MDEITKTELIVREAEGEVQRAHERLSEQLLALRDKVERVLVRLRREGTEASVNGLGEVQGLGLDVDRACALYEAAKRTKNVVTHALAIGRKES
jgi:hypothetical protein